MAAEFIETFIDLNKDIYFIDHGGYESRSESTIALFSLAFDQINMDLITKSLHFFIHIGDTSANLNNELTFGYTTAQNVIPCPDFIFDRWIECGIANYDETTSKILQAGEHQYSIGKLFWTGNLDTQQLRHELFKLGEKNKNMMEIIPMQWQKEHKRGSMHRYNTYTSLEDHTKYKYLIDCGARGYSGRMKLLLHSNRPLFLVDRQDDKKDFFYKDLVAFHHYIPVNEDLSDLISKLEWAENNYVKALDIAKNARDFAVGKLNKKTAINYLASTLQSNLMRYQELLH